MISVNRGTVGRVEMSSLRVTDALVGAATAPRGRDSGARALQIKAPVSPAVCQNQRVTSLLGRTVAPATATKIHKRLDAERMTLLLLFFFSPFSMAPFTRDNASVCFPPCDAGGARQWACTLCRCAGLKWSTLKAGVQSGSDVFV